MVYGYRKPAAICNGHQMKTTDSMKFRIVIDFCISMISKGFIHAATDFRSTFFLSTFMRISSLAFQGAFGRRSAGLYCLFIFPTFAYADLPELLVSDLNGRHGFVVNGYRNIGFAGESLSRLGDVNGDGFDDFVIGAHGLNNGEAYVVFGSAAIGSGGVIELSSLNGSNGFSIVSEANGQAKTGQSVSDAGDINNDGISDILIGAPGIDIGLTNSGSAYVIFGDPSIGLGGVVPGVVSLADVAAGAGGFVMRGPATSWGTGQDVNAIGDFNGDGFDDVLVGSNAFNSLAGAHVVFGGSGIAASNPVQLAALTGTDGFYISGTTSQHRAGYSVSNAGDINNDGTNDLIIGTFTQNITGETGRAFVLFGGSAVGSTGTVDLSGLDGTNGFVVEGIDANDLAGSAVSDLGDINDDGIDDFLVGASGADGTASGSGEVYIVFGSTSVVTGGVLNASSLDGTNGFVINGPNLASFLSRYAMRSRVDFNEDGIGDILIGAEGANGPVNQTGHGYLLFGSSGIGSTGTINFPNLAATDGLVLKGQGVGDGLGYSVSSAGDINGDNHVDLLFGAFESDLNGDRIGQIAVLLGPMRDLCGEKFPTIELSLGDIPTPGDDVVMGTSGADDIRGRAGNDTICGIGGDDFLHGNSGDDWIDGGDGIDNLRGGQGNDILFTGSGTTAGTTSIAFGGTGNDEINGGVDADDLRGGRGIDIINGNQGDDEITGNADADIINGGPGDDELRGGQGDDVLNGDSGDDFLSGGGGSSDTCDGGSGSSDVATASCETAVNIP